MRPQPNLRAARTAAAAALAATGIAAAMPHPAAGAATASPSAVPAVGISLSDSTLRAGDSVRVAGRTSARQGGRTIALEFRRAGRGWRTAAVTRVGRDGRFRFAVRARHSGSLRAVLRAAVASDGPTAGTAIRSRARGVSVSAAVLRPARDVGVHHGRRAVLSGVLAPRTPGRAVTLEQHRHGTWSRVARATTDARGVFRFRFTPKEVGSWPLRVRFGGDRANAGTVRRVGRLNSFRSSLASWYGAYGGAVACGGTLGYNEMGVAHKWLPCGTRLTIRYHGRTVQAKVIDRGPYAGGREFDLSGAVARKLGFGGVGLIEVTR